MDSLIFNLLYALVVGVLVAVSMSRVRRTNLYLGATPSLRLVIVAVTVSMLVFVLNIFWPSIYFGTT
ncbi:MAG: hypothetical protein AB4058_10360 [Microcystaceae cyanobacterium]